jgi:hypothetical protein
MSSRTLVVRRRNGLCVRAAVFENFDETRRGQPCSIELQHLAGRGAWVEVNDESPFSYLCVNYTAHHSKH